MLINHVDILNLLSSIEQLDSETNVFLLEPGCAHANLVLLLVTRLAGLRDFQLRENEHVNVLLARSFTTASSCGVVFYPTIPVF